MLTFSNPHVPKRLLNLPIVFGMSRFLILSEDKKRYSPSFEILEFSANVQLVNAAHSERNFVPTSVTLDGMINDITPVPLKH